MSAVYLWITLLASLTLLAPAAAVLLLSILHGWTTNSLLMHALLCNYSVQLLVVSIYKPLMSCGGVSVGHALSFNGIAGTCSRSSLLLAVYMPQGACSIY